MDNRSSQSAAFYHDPPLWVGESPIDDVTQPWQVDFEAFKEVVYEGKVGPMRFKALREGMFKFDFTE